MKYIALKKAIPPHKNIKECALQLLEALPGPWLDSSLLQEPGSAQQLLGKESM